MTNVHAQRLLALCLSCFVMVFLGSTVVIMMEPSAPFNQEFSSISCSFFSCIQLTIHSRALRLLCVASFKADNEKKNLNLPSVMCFRGHLSTWRTHVWRRQIMNRIVHVGLSYILRKVFDHACTRSSSIGFSFFSFLWVHWNRNDTKSMTRNGTKSVTSVNHSNKYSYYCLIADGGRLHVSC